MTKEMDLSIVPLQMSILNHLSQCGQGKYLTDDQKDKTSTKQKTKFRKDQNNETKDQTRTSFSQRPFFCCNLVEYYYMHFLVFHTQLMYSPRISVFVTLLAH